ncbi:hypothetical protein PPBDW_I20148 [Photobacterium kishitanii]|nr:hypothetical protein PPBDW_I20148 [Photobacterium kishitanii]
MFIPLKIKNLKNQSVTILLLISINDWQFYYDDPFAKGSSWSLLFI